MTTEKQKEFIEKQVEYWQVERATNNFVEGEKSVYELARDLKLNYINTSTEIEEKINAFYGKYATENEMDLQTARQLLNKGELKSFKAYIERMINMGNRNNFSTDEMNEFKRLYNKAKITRLEELQANIRGELDKLTADVDKSVGNMLADSYEEGYYKSVYNTQVLLNDNRSFSGLNKNAINQAVRTKWIGANYSDNIWQNNKNTLTKLLETEIPRGITLGYNPKKIARDIVNPRIDKTMYNNTVRLMRTEYSKIQNDASLDGYKAAGIKQYQIVAELDERTCDVCHDVFNGEVFDYDEAETGLNFPPFHPNCRCTTVAYFPKDEIDSMSREELEGIGFVTYDEWRSGLVKLENGKVKYAKNLRKE